MTDKPQKASIVRVVASTLAAFVGVQSEKNRRADFQQSSIVPFMIVGIVLASLFIVGLIAVAKFIAP